MKVWFDRSDIDFTVFHSEQFLIINMFRDEVLKKNNDFRNSLEWKLDIGNIVSESSIEDCDFILYPKKLDAGIKKYIDLAKPYNKKVIAFFNDDISSSVALTDICLYRTSFYKSKKLNNEFCMPAWSEDLLSGDLTIRCKGDLPIISFCGAITHPIRKDCLDILTRHDKVITSLIVRDSFWGGKIHDADLRREYISNITNSDLVLCCRGAGNFSYRLYESLSLGRIPIIVDTDLPLPCSDVINWNSFIITSPANIIEGVVNFWKKTTPEEFKQLQLYTRHIYKLYLSPSGFANYLNYNYI